MVIHTKYAINTAWATVIKVKFQLKLNYHHFWKTITIYFYRHFKVIVLIKVPHHSNRLYYFT
jgi:hypothetical protein